MYLRKLNFLSKKHIKASMQPAGLSNLSSIKRGLYTCGSWLFPVVHVTKEEHRNCVKTAKLWNNALKN